MQRWAREERQRQWTASYSIFKASLRSLQDSLRHRSLSLPPKNSETSLSFWRIGRTSPSRFATHRFGCRRICLPLCYAAGTFACLLSPARALFHSRESMCRKRGKQRGIGHLFLCSVSITFWCKHFVSLFFDAFGHFFACPLLQQGERDLWESGVTLGVPQKEVGKRSSVTFILGHFGHFCWRFCHF